MKVPNCRACVVVASLSLSRLQNEGSQHRFVSGLLYDKSIKATE